MPTLLQAIRIIKINLNLLFRLFSSQHNGAQFRPDQIFRPIVSHILETIGPIGLIPLRLPDKQLIRHLINISIVPPLNLPISRGSQKLISSLARQPEQVSDRLVMRNVYIRGHGGLWARDSSVPDPYHSTVAAKGYLVHVLVVVRELGYRWFWGKDVTGNVRIAYVPYVARVGVRFPYRVKLEFGVRDGYFLWTIRVPGYWGDLTLVRVVVEFENFQSFDIYFVGHLDLIFFVFEIIFKHVYLIVLTQNYLDCFEHLF